MNFTFENQGTHTYLVYTVEAGEQMDSMSLGMLTNNRIPGLAQTLFTQLDATRYIKYDVSAKISVSQFFGGQVNKKRLLGVFNGIVDALLSAEEYMLDVNSVLLDLDYIFADVTTCETVLVCIPVEEHGQKTVDLGAFFKNIMFTTQFDQTENCDHVAKIINYLNSSPVFSLYDFKNVLESIETGSPFSDRSSIQGVQNVQTVPDLSIDHRKPPQQPITPNIPVTQTPPTQTPPPEEEPISPPMRRGRTVADKTEQNPTPPVGMPPKAPATTVTPPVGMPPRNAGGVGGGMPGGMNPNIPRTGMNPNGVPNGEKEMTLIGLLSHYNKENAAKYKEQQERKKNGMPPVNPGAPANGGFAIPGQGTAPVQQPPIPSNRPPMNNGGRPTPPNTPPMNNGGRPTPPNTPPMNNGGRPTPPNTPPMNNGGRPGTPANGGFAIPGQGTAPAQQPPIPSNRPPMNNGGRPTPPNTPPMNNGGRPTPPTPPNTPPANPPQRPMGFEPIPSTVVPQGRPSNFGETTVLGTSNNIGETTVLGAIPEARVQPFLVRLKNNEKVNITKPVFRIGKEKSYVDYFIADNSAISRSHANIIKKGEEYFIVDTNSTNHTYVNGVMINSNVETKLAHKTRLRLANEEFELNLY